MGALLWVLDLAQDKQNRSYVAGDEEYRFSLGMGKPLGMGAVKINHQLWLSERKQRYENMFTDNRWETGERNDTKVEADFCLDAFKRYVLEGIGEDPEGNLEDVQRIKMLLKILSFPGKPRGKTRYMEIEHLNPNSSKPENEYDKRPVLPNPFQI